MGVRVRGSVRTQVEPSAVVNVGAAVPTAAVTAGRPCPPDDHPATVPGAVRATVPAAGEGWAGGVTRGPAVGGTKVGCAPEFGGDPALALVPAIVIPGAAYLPDAERVSEPRWI